MKTTFNTLCLFLFSSFLFNCSAQIFVKQDANGDGNGSTWENAFTDLQDALAVAETGDSIWVAAGTYLPGISGSSPTESFIINQNIKLYGGFAGDEVSVADRVPGNETILSGDLGGDDMEGDFENNKSDNVMTVLTILSTVTNAAMVDGFTIQGGYADGNGDDLSPERSGGGIHCLGYPVLQNCIFKQNKSEYRGGGAYFSYLGTEVVEIHGCSFIGNETSGRGGGLNINDSNSIISDCVFQSNEASQHGGGLRYYSSTSNRSVEIYNCSFESNAASHGGGLRLRSSSLGVGFLVYNCSFNQNAAEPLFPGWGQWGGGFSCEFYPNSGDNNLTVEKCTFLQNTSQFEAGAFVFGNAGFNASVLLDSCTFLQNESFGTNTYGSISISNNYPEAYGSILIDNCRIEGNTSFSSGGIDIGSRPGAAPSDYTISQCTFKNNIAQQSGGGLTLYQEAGTEAEFLVENCIFEGNQASDHAGGLYLTTGGIGFNATIRSSTFFENTSLTGAAIGSFPDIANDADATLGHAQIESCLFFNNESEDAAIALTDPMNMTLTNSTLAKNETGGILLKEQSQLILQNNILYNPGYTEFESLLQEVNLTSNGGNLLSDSSLVNATIEDLVNSNPEFVGSGDSCQYFQLSSISPAIDAGTDWSGAPATDMCGADRIQNNSIDIGAFESEFILDLNKIFVTEIGVFPNPASDYINIQYPESVTSAFQAQLFDSRGKLIKSETLSDDQNIPIKDLTAGFYTVKIKDNTQVYVGRFVKH